MALIQKKFFKPFMAITLENISVQDNPSPIAPTIFVISKDTEVMAIAESHLDQHWYQIRYKSQIGWLLEH